MQMPTWTLRVLARPEVTPDRLWEARLTASQANRGPGDPRTRSVRRASGSVEKSLFGAGGLLDRLRIAAPRAMLDVVNLLMQDFPDEPEQPVSNGPDGYLGSLSHYQAAEYILKIAALCAHCCPCQLV